ncbi:hypothetical protein [Klebsiella michiganensis]|uniref:hypothetical protein n=2 Tax=Klebsiella michiganensis TaxID=1134687 RepID=UPI0012BA2C85|nr:hypothetical protein [Klebsiella michiganensis]MBE0114188.1 hypothetical protein [Klebsiella michiganensis]
MSTYKTGHPLGSAAVKDLFDNAENLDFALNSLTALIWTDRLGKTRRSFFGMESAFVTQLSSQESRFNTFIQSSGYQIVGDYTAGPLTLTDYNQLIRYNNELYKLTAATDIPFTTAGNTDETWTSTDAAHFVSVGDAALRQNLGSGEGLSLLGSISPRSGLRNVKTSYNGQSILMKQAAPGGPVLNAIATHKPGMTAQDDDYSTFITADGQVYQFDVSAGIDFRLAGALLDGSNAGVCIKKIVDTEVSKAIAAGSINACKKMVLINPPGNNDLTQLILDTDETFVVPSFISLWHVGQVRYKFNGLTKPAFRICNEIDGLTSGMVDFVDRQGAEVIKGNGYMVEIIGPNPATYDEWYALTQTNPAAVSSAAGIEFGNTYSSKTLLDCRDTIIENVAIERFHGGLRLHGFDTYINIFRNLKITSCVYTFYEPDADKSNAGENLRFEGGTFGNCYRSHFYINQVGLSRTYVGCSFDYARQNFLELRSSGRGNDFIYENCWIEGFGDFLIRQYPITDTWSFRKNKITFSGGKIVGAKGSQTEWAPRRKIILAPTDNNKIEFINTQIEWPSPPSEPQIALMGYTDDTIKYNPGRYSCPGTAYEDELLNYAYGLKGNAYKFSGTEGASVKDSKDTATNISFDTNNNATGFKVEYGPVDDDGLRCVKITTTATTDLVELSDKRLMVKAPQHTVVNAGISIKMAAVTAGAVTFGMRLRAYNNPVSKADSTTFIVTKTYTLNGSLASDPYNVSSLLSATGTPLTTDKYVGVQTSRDLAFDSTVATHFVPTMTVTGYVGTIYLKLPVWWISNGSAPAAYSIEES